MSKPEPQENDRRTKAELREEAIRKMIDVAIRLIAEKGASRLSIAEVGLAAGYSHSLPNYHFKTKKNLLLDVYSFIVEDYLRVSKKRLSRRAGGPVRAGMDYLESTVRAYFGLADTPGARAIHVLWAESVSSLPELHEEIRESNRRNLDHMEAHVRIAIERGEIDASVDPKAVAVMLMGQLRGVLAQKILDPERVDLDALADTVVATLKQGLAPKRAPESSLAESLASGPLGPGTS